MSGRPRRALAGPELTIALLVPDSRTCPTAAIEAAREVSEDVLLVGGAASDAGDGGVRHVPVSGGGLHARMASALGSARGRWTLFVRGDEVVHTPHARTLARYLRHETAAGFFVPMNDRLPLLRVLPTAAGRLWGDDPLASQAALEADPGRRALSAEGLTLSRGAGDSWPARPTRPGDAWLRAVRALAAGSAGAAAREARALPATIADTSAAWDLRGEIAFWRERWDDAAAYFTRAGTEAVQRFDPAAQHAAVGLGRLAEVRGDLEGARAAYRAALASMPLDGGALARLLAVEWRLGASWPESVGRLVRDNPWAWRGIGRALDRVTRPEVQLRSLRSMPMSYGRDLFMARAALAVGDVALARRCLARAERDVELSALAYQAWLVEIAGGSAAEARAAAARAGALTASARLALLLAATSVLGESAELPLLRSDEALEVGQWLLVALSDLCLLGLGTQARLLARLIGRVLGSAGAAQAAAVMWRAAHPGAGAARRRGRAVPRRTLVLPAPDAAGWLSHPVIHRSEEAH